MADFELDGDDRRENPDKKRKEVPKEDEEEPEDNETMPPNWTPDLDSLRFLTEEKPKEQEAPKKKESGQELAPGPLGSSGMELFDQDETEKPENGDRPTTSPEQRGQVFEATRPLSQTDPATATETDWDSIQPTRHVGAHNSKEDTMDPSRQIDSKTPPEPVNMINPEPKELQKETDSDEGLKDPFEVAKAGGKNFGMYVGYKDKPSDQIEKGIQSLGERIAEHEDKIANPTKHIPNWEDLDPRQRNALLTSQWPEDIKRQQEQKRVLEGILDER